MPNETKSTTYVVKKAKKSSDGKKTFYQEIGKLLIRESGNGVLFLHMLDGEFAVFTKEQKADEPEAPAEE